MILSPSARRAVPTLALALLGSIQPHPPLFANPPAASAEAFALAVPAGSPREPDGLKADPAVVWGRLENGFRYAILPNPNPGRRASLCLLVQVGSYQEQDNELGYAHFIEHMAFRSTREFAGDNAIKALQRHGVAFGPHVNAETSIFETSYRFENLPTDDLDALTTGLTIFRSMADGVLLDKNEVDQERGVIFSERRVRGYLSGNLRKDELEFLSPYPDFPHKSELLAEFEGSRVAKRFPMGDEKNLRSANPRKLRAFYDRWYRPERMVLTVVGAIDPAKIEDMVRKTFSTFAGRGASPAEVPLKDPLGDAHKRAPAIYVQMRTGERSALLDLCASIAEEPDTKTRRRKQLVRQVALSLLDARLGRASEKPEAPFITARTSRSHYVPGWESISLRATCSPNAWEKALTASEIELRQACAYGFSEDELQRYLKETDVRLAAAREHFAYPSSMELAPLLAFSAARGLVFTSAEEDLSLSERYIHEVTTEQCRLALVELFPTSRLCVALSGDFEKDLPTPELVRKRLADNQKLALQRSPEKAARKPFPYTDFGIPGAIVKQEHDPILDADLIQFANGVHLNLKRTAFEQGRVFLGFRIEGGRLACPDDKPGLDRFFPILKLGGLRELSANEEIAALPDLSAWGTGVTNGATEGLLFRIGNSSGLRSALQDTAAHFLYPSFRDEDWTKTKEYTLEQLAPSQNTASGVGLSTMIRRLTDGHPGLTSTSLEVVNRRTLGEFKEWFPSKLTTAPLEIVVLGDFDPQAAIEEIARTFGALPPRVQTEASASARRLIYSAKTFSETITCSCLGGTAAVLFAWPVKEELSSKDRIGGALLAGILEDRLRLKLRAEMGDAYSPFARFSEDNGFTPSFAYLSCTVDAAPQHTARVSSAMRKVVEQLVGEGATPVEFERARQPLVRQCESRLLNDTNWLTALTSAQARHSYAADWVHAVTDFKEATVEEVNALARRLLNRDRQNELTVLSISAEASVRFARARAKSAKEDYRGAIAECDKTLSLNPGYALVYVERGNSRVELKDFPGGLADFDRAIQLDPNEASAFYRRARLKEQKEDHTGALADFDRCLALDPSNADGYEERGTVKETQGDHLGAIADFTQALALNPEYSFSYFFRGQCKEALDDHSGAITDFDQWLRLKPDDPGGYNQRGASKHNRGDEVGAIADYTRQIALSPKDGSGYSGRARCKNALKDYAGAIADYSQSVALSPKDGGAYFWRALSKDALKDYAGELKDLDIFLSLERNDAYGYERRGRAKAALLDHKGAIVDYTQAITLNAPDSGAYYWRAVSSDLTGDHTGAIADFDHWLTSNPDDAEAFYRRGRAKEATGDHHAAISDFDRAISLKPNKSYFYLHRAKARKAVGDVEGARLDDEHRKQLKTKDENSENAGKLPFPSPATL